MSRAPASKKSGKSCGYGITPPQMTIATTTTSLEFLTKDPSFHSSSSRSSSLLTAESIINQVSRTSVTSVAMLELKHEGSQASNFFWIHMARKMASKVLRRARPKACSFVGLRRSRSTWWHRTFVTRSASTGSRVCFNKLWFASRTNYPTSAKISPTTRIT